MSRGLLPEARHLVLPGGIVSTGWPSVRETLASVGVELDPWQVDLSRGLLGKTADGLYAADTVAMSIGRQVGKTFLVGALCFADCIASPGTTVVWTAHRFKVSRETFNELRGLAKSPKLVGHVDYEAITTAAGNECIPFRNGSRIVFAARERGAIRGFTKVRRLVLDEAQILTNATLSDLAPTLNQAVNPQIILMGTPPKPSDPDEVFSELRATALDGSAEGLLYVELAADESCLSDDLDALRTANPSVPERTPYRAVDRLRKLLSDEDFRREALGIWDSEASSAVVPAPVWVSRTAESAGSKSLVVALDASLKLTDACLAVAYVRPDGDIHGELLHREGAETVDCRPGVDWVGTALADLRSRIGELAPVRIVKGGSAEALVESITRAGCLVERVSASDVSAACGVVHSLITSGGVWHSGQPELTAAVAATRWRDTGEGGQCWGRKRSTGNIAPFYAWTLAVAGAYVTKRDSGSFFSL